MGKCRGKGSEKKIVPYCALPFTLENAGICQGQAFKNKTVVQMRIADLLMWSTFLAGNIFL